jgi:hypothetical protein
MLSKVWGPELPQPAHVPMTRRNPPVCIKFQLRMFGTAVEPSLVDGWQQRLPRATAGFQGSCACWQRCSARLLACCSTAVMCGVTGVR